MANHSGNSTIEAVSTTVQTDDAVKDESKHEIPACCSSTQAFGSSSESDLLKRLRDERKRVKRLKSKSRYRRYRLPVLDRAIRLLEADARGHELAALLERIGISTT